MSQRSQKTSSSNAQEKIIKSWAGIGEDAIIKEVATKGEHISLAITYWARKRKIPESEYRLYFHDVVKTYVERLLTERLVCKAENVLRNVKRDVKCFYYQFAFECEDAELRETVLDYLRRKDGQAFELEEQKLQFYWSLLQRLRECTQLLVKFRQKLPRASLEGLINLEPSYQQRLFVELYFVSGGSEELLQQLNKLAIWEYLVDMQQVDLLCRWCQLAMSNSDKTAINSLEQRFAQLTIENGMFEYALQNLAQKSETLRNCFAREGYFFEDEKNDIPVVLRRICTTETLKKHKSILENLPLAKFLLEHGYYAVMLQPLVSEREIEELSGESNPLLKFILELKPASLENRDGFEKIAQATKNYLNDVSETEVEEPLVIFNEFLCHEPNIASLNAFMTASSLSRVPYLKALMLRSEHASTNTQPTSHDFLRKFKGINLGSLNRSDGDIASFSNDRLRDRYARKYQLNYMHFLRQNRSAFAAYYLLTDHLQLYGQITRTQLFNASETITEMALTQAGNCELLAHCVACCEMLGFDTQYLRCFLQLKKLIYPTTDITYSNLIKSIDGLLTEQIIQNESEFPLQNFDALMRLSSLNLSSKQYPQQMMKHFAQTNDWWHLLVVLQYFDLPLNEFKSLVDHFKTRTLGEHLFHALSNNIPINERSTKRNATRQHNRRSEKSKNTNSTETIETMSTSIGSFNESNIEMCSSHLDHLNLQVPDYGQKDLFAIVLLSGTSVREERVGNLAKFLEIMQSTNSQSTSWNILRNCIKSQQPILAVLATTMGSVENIDWCWLVWLTVSTEQWSDFLQWAVKSEHDCIWSVIRNAVRQGQTATLLSSFQIFYKKNQFLHMCRFLTLTQNAHDFSDLTIAELRLFLLGWSNDEVRLPLCPESDRDVLMQNCINLLLTHLQNNFNSTLHQQKFLDCICRSDFSDICGLLDFCLLNKVFAIAATWMRQLSTNFELLVKRDSKEYTRLLNALIEAKAYNVATQIATLLQFPICDIVYSKWVAEYDSGTLQSYDQYEQEINKNALPPEILVNFFLYAAMREPKPCMQRYRLLKSALDVIKQHHLFPNESFDRDQIEYDMILCYLQITEEADIKFLDIYHSEYFEQIMLKERCVLYKSFLELKELAGIDDLSISAKVTLTTPMEVRLAALLNALLDQGDIVEALRVQELFEYRPTDLRFIVFCMALAEGVTTIYNLSSKERQLLSEIEKGAFAKFNKLTLNQSTLGRCSSEQLSDSCSTLEFEEIPSKEKQQTAEIIQGIASKLKYGIDLGKRIVLVYRAAMYLDKEYLDVLRTKDVSVLLNSAADEECLRRLMVVSDILISTHMTPNEIADMLALELTTCIVRPRFYIFTANHHPSSVFKNADLWGYNIDRDFHLFLELTPNTTILGNSLLEYCDALKAYRRYQDNKPFEDSDAFQRLSDIITRYGLPTPATVSVTNATTGGPPQVLSHKKQNIIYVELLIKAHLCFVHECSMEGIANVLHRAKSLNTLLAIAKSWSLIVRLLIGIGRYREMFYCFDTLIENNQFESLLGHFDEEQKYGLRQAILSYLREYNPQGSRELLKLSALHFRMYKELAEMWEQEAQVLLLNEHVLAHINCSQLPDQDVIPNLVGPGNVKTEVSKLKSTPEVLQLLQQVMENYTHATENYLLDNKLLLAQQSASMAELIAMQIDLASKAVGSYCISVIHVHSRDEFRELVIANLSVPQSLILSRAYSFDINWSEALLSQFVILQRSHYLDEYLAYQRISDSVIENVVKGYMHYGQHNNLNSKMEKSLMQLVELIKSVTLKYKLASLLSFKSIVMSLINDSTCYYLRDTNFGRSENHNMPDM